MHICIFESLQLERSYVGDLFYLKKNYVPKRNCEHDVKIVLIWELNRLEIFVSNSCKRRAHLSRPF